MFSQDEKQLKVAIYARVSTEEQAEHGYSIDAQCENLKQYCKLYNKTVIKEYIDAGVSGKEMTKRKQLQELMLDVEKGIFDEVLVWKINRMSRKTKDLLEIVEHLNKHNVYFRSISENFDTSNPMGKFALQMMGAVGELERNTIVENVKMGLKQRAKMGYHNGGSCLGYKAVEILGSGKNKKKTLQVVPEEALIVRKIFNLYISGRGFRSIANQLNHEGHRTKKGNTFSSDSIREIVTNPIYVGIVRYNRYENWSEKRRLGKNKTPILEKGKHEAIITQETWEKAQMLFGEKSKEAPRVFDSENLLTGLIRCPECGTPMVISRSHYRLKDGSKIAQRYYSCGTFKSKGSSVCHANSVRADYAEQYVLERIKEVITHPKILSSIVTAINKKLAKKPLSYEKELLLTNRKLEESDSKRNKLIDVYEMDGIDKETLSKRLDELQEEIDQLEDRKKGILNEIGGKPAHKVSTEYVRELLIKLDGAIEQSNTEQKKMLLRLAIQEITLKESKEIDKIMLAFDDDLQRYISKENPSANKVDGFLLYTGRERGKVRRLKLAI